jgi:hypothetical protein
MGCEVLFHSSGSFNEYEPDEAMAGVQDELKSPMRTASVAFGAHSL